jgi:hypothetical protein
MRKVAAASIVAVALLTVPSVAFANTKRSLSVRRAEHAITGSVVEETQPSRVEFVSCDRRSRTVVGCWTRLFDAHVDLIEIENETDGSKTSTSTEPIVLYFMAHLRHGHAVVGEYVL